MRAARREQPARHTPNLQGTQPFMVINLTSLTGSKKFSAKNAYTAAIYKVLYFSRARGRAMSVIVSAISSAQSTGQASLSLVLDLRPTTLGMFRMPQRKPKSGSRPKKLETGLPSTAIMAPRPEDVSETEEMFVHVLRRIVHQKIARRNGALTRFAR
jgi:hypothetical protein